MDARSPAEETFTGAPWRPGLPPGVYEERPARRAPATVRMDVAAFLGLAERGPLATPVPVASHGEFMRVFGASGRDRLLGPSLRLFFDNGGRRAVILRVADAAAATTARFSLGALRAGGAPLVLSARNPGRWGNRIALSGRFRRRFLSLSRPAGAHPPLLPFEAIAAAGAALVAGSLLRLRTQGAHPPPILFVTDLVERGGERIVRLSAPPPAAALLPGGAPGDALLVGEEITLDLDVSIDAGKVHGLSETWRDLRFSPLHPDFLARRLGRRAFAERLAQPERYDPARPDHADFEATERHEALMPADPRLAGSEIVRPEAVDWIRPVLPDEVTLSAGGAFRLDPIDIPDGGEGSDGEASTARHHFFEPPAAGAFGRQPAPLEALARHDALFRTEPVSLVAAPDLAHARPGDLAPPAPEAEEDGAAFRDCAIPRAAPPDLLHSVSYPRLCLAHDRAGLADAQRRLVEWCTALGDRVAVLDLPPHLWPGAIVAWRSMVASDRAALYAPWLLVDAGDADAAPLAVPPSGAAAGLIARREAISGGVQHAPANLAVSGALGRLPDPELPSAAFLHAERVDAIRPTETGLSLLGARTTSLDADYTHLSVRRLVDFLKRQLAIDLEWAAFEPNGPPLWRRVRTAVEGRLGRLHDAAAFAGASRAEAFFVRCDRTTMTAADLDMGRLICLVGVAPAVPMEFVVFRLTRLG